MNQSMAVAYATLGKEFLALILKVVMVRTVVTPEERKVKNQLQVKDTGNVLDEGHQRSSSHSVRTLKLCCLWSSLLYISVINFCFSFASSNGLFLKQIVQNITAG